MVADRMVLRGVKNETVWFVKLADVTGAPLLRQSG